MREPGRPRALVVDDIPTNRRHLAWVLGKAGYDVEMAVSGPHAVTALMRSDYELVVTDLNLGGEFEGAETVRRLRERSPTVRMVAVTSDSSINVVNEIDQMQVELVSRGTVQAYFIDMVPGRSVEDQIQRAVASAIEAIMTPVMTKAGMLKSDGKPDLEKLGDTLYRSAARRRMLTSTFETVKARLHFAFAAAVVAAVFMALQWMSGHAAIDVFKLLRDRGAQ